MLWDIDAKNKDALFSDLGVKLLERKRAKPEPLTHHHATPTDRANPTQNKVK